MELEILQLITFLVMAILVTVVMDTINTKTVVITLAFVSIYIFTIDGWEGDRKHTHNYTTTKTLVSAAPSHTQVEGSISGGFLMFSGVIGESRVYLLREEVEKGLYKDFEVKKEVYIREDDGSRNKGKFVQHFQCYDISTHFDLYGYEFLHRTVNKCAYQKQEIVVPVGSVIKELNI
tara:strand:+ start:312 stop:842 length:531 start_codon:yes stop_codon:yes gene_type:complete